MMSKQQTFISLDSMLRQYGLVKKLIAAIILNINTQGLVTIKVSNITLAHFYFVESDESSLPFHHFSLVSLTLAH